MSGSLLSCTSPHAHRKCGGSSTIIGSYVRDFILCDLIHAPRADIRTIIGTPRIYRLSPLAPRSARTLAAARIARSAAPPAGGLARSLPSLVLFLSSFVSSIRAGRSLVYINVWWNLVLYFHLIRRNKDRSEFCFCYIGD